MAVLPKVGKKLGCGAFRCVYEYGTTTVIKINHSKSKCYDCSGRGGGTKANQREWKVWNRIKATPLAPWFAKAYSLTPAGDLIMERASCIWAFSTCRDKDKALKLRIAELTGILDIYDGYSENVGYVNGQPKILDYQMIDLRRLPSGIRLVEGWA